jgi:hypothetical protein
VALVREPRIRGGAIVTFDIRSYIQALTLHKELPTEWRYICPICQGNNLTIAKDSGAYQCWNGCDSADIRNLIAPLNLPKPTRPASDKTWTYTNSDGLPLIRTRRIDDGQGQRKIWQEYFSNGKWLKRGNDAAKKAVMPYNHAAVMDAITKGEPVFWVEGEPCVEALERIGLVGTTSIGGSAGYTKYGDYSKVY